MHDKKIQELFINQTDKKSSIENIHKKSGFILIV